VRGNGAVTIPRRGPFPELSNRASPPTEPEVSLDDYDALHADEQALPPLLAAGKFVEVSFSFDPRRNDLKTEHLMRAVILAVLLNAFLSFAACGAGKAEHVVVVVWDGMRPDFITEQDTPTLHHLAQEGVFFRNHHPVFLSATEVNGTSIATGAYPVHSGIMANKEYRPSINPLMPVGTESSLAVRAGDRLTQGHYLDRLTIAEILHNAGHTTAVAGTKPVALLHDRKERDAEYRLGQVLYYDKTLPTNTWERLNQELGPYPAYTQPNAGRDQWTTRAMIGPLWKAGVPKFSFLWLSEPDYSQHDTGVGSTNSLAALRSSDRNLALLLAELDQQGVRAKTDVLVVSDHGFSTISQSIDVARALQNAGFNAARQFTNRIANDDILAVSNGGATLLYVIGHDAHLIRRIVDFLQTQEFTGVLFTRNRCAGAFTLDQAFINTPNAPDVVIGMRWMADRSSNGTPGLVFYDGSDRKPGEGMHVTLSRFDMHNTLVAAGPDFRRGVSDELPTGNVDVAPTILWILGITPPQPMDGRVLTEALTIDGPRVGRPKTTQIEAKNPHGKFIWRQYLKRTELNGVVYLDEGNGGAERR
jgi:predicted AlkP superfamily pyrophosphatase or phosphodiesterase